MQSEGDLEAFFDVNLESLQLVSTSLSCSTLTNSSLISENLGNFTTFPSSTDYRSFGTLCLEGGVEYTVAISFTSGVESQWLLDSVSCASVNNATITWRKLYVRE